MLIAFTSICFFCLVYAYVGYPLVMWVLSKFTPSKEVSSAPLNDLPNLSVIVTAHNEETHIEAKLNNTLSAIAYYKQEIGREVELIVASDGSEDGTDAKVCDFKSHNVKLVRLYPASGKESAQKKALEEVGGDVVVFTDAKVQIAEDSLVKLSRYFEDAQIGAVSSLDIVEGDAVVGSGEGFYVRYEMWLRSLESKCGSLVGLSGSFFAVRRELTTGLRVDLPSDFSLLLSVKKKGLKGLHAEDVIHTYRAVKTEEQEFSRKVRTVLRGITTVFKVREVLNPKVYGLFAGQVFSHKICRWLVPFWGIGAWLGSLFLMSVSVFFLITALLGTIVLGFALLGFFTPSIRCKLWIKIPLFFVVSNAAIMMAWFSFVRGKRTVSWRPTNR